VWAFGSIPRGGPFIFNGRDIAAAYIRISYNKTHIKMWVGNTTNPPLWYLGLGFEKGRGLDKGSRVGKRVDKEA